MRSIKPVFLARAQKALERAAGWPGRDGHTDHEGAGDRRHGARWRVPDRRAETVTLAEWIEVYRQLKPL